MKGIREAYRVRAAEVEVDGALPHRTEVVVIGGGIAGISMAWALATRGIPCVVLEKGAVAAEQSSRAFGWVSNLCMSPVKAELSCLAKRLWKQLAETLGPDSLGYVRSGLLYPFARDEDLLREASWIEAVKGHDIQAEVLNGSQVRNLLKGVNSTYVGGLFQSTDGRVEPSVATTVLASHARSLGAAIVAPCAARGIELSSGRVDAVVTELGIIRTNQVVLAGGSWSRLFCGNLGLDLPQQSVYSSLLELGPVEGGPEVACAAEGYAFRRSATGGFIVGPSHGHVAHITPDSIRQARRFLPAYLNQRGILKLRIGREFLDDLKTPRRWRLDEVSPFERKRVWDPDPDVGINAQTLAAMHTEFPHLVNVPVKDQWAGMIDATADSMPVISPVDKIPGLLLNTGYSAYGLTLAPAGAEALAALMAGKTPAVDLRPFRFSRFHDGTKLVVSP